MSSPQEILNFWFGEPGSETYGKFRPIWFEVNEEFAGEVRRRFLADFEAAVAGKLAHWEETPEGALALILLFDQFTLLLFRGATGAFDQDPEAQRIARMAVERGDDQQFPEMHRWFFYLVFEHSENAADQERAVQLFSALSPTETNKIGLDFAIRHKRVVDRFGRFPNRNEALGRESTPEELEFLAGPDAPF
jgi:uncharacterized protein (DUF924 family)